MQHICGEIRVLSEEEICAIIESALKILSEKGVVVPHTAIRATLGEEGATIEGEVVLYPREMVLPLIEKWRSKHRRMDPADRVVQPIYGNVSTQIYVFDPFSKTRRPGTKNDLLKGIRLVDQLDAFETNNAVVYPGDVPIAIQDIYALHEVLTYAKKPGKTYYLSAASAEYAFRMLESAGREINGYLTPISPLQYSQETLEICRLAALHHGKITTGSMITAGLTGPITAAGTLVLATAEILSSQIIIEALTGESAEFGCICHTMEPANLMCSFGAYTQGLFAAAGSQIAEYLGLPSRANAGLSDALCPDFQSATEKVSSAMMSMLSGCHAVGAMGIAGADQGICYEQLVLDNEWLRTINRMLSGITVDSETLAIEVILSVGHHAGYLDADFTAEHLRDQLLTSSVFRRQTYSDWTSDGALTAMERARDQVEELTAGYQDMHPVIDEDTKVRLDEILEEATKTLVK